MICECGKEMHYLGNISNVVYTSNPVQWDETYVCFDCKTKRSVRKSGPITQVKLNLADFREIK